ncbi:MAG: hypothetical protein NHB14_00255 [Desulfosporosinus sp.]|nr:hypothetical protein [Desulfosporosinus sp.]MDA8221776.1 hypothetical protein [Desulfitobacterium hafniense]
MATNTATPRVRGSRKKITMDGNFPEVKPIERNEKESGSNSGCFYSGIYQQTKGIYVNQKAGRLGTTHYDGLC